MSKTLGSRQEQIILFLDSQIYKRSTREEIREYFKKLENIPDSKIGKVDNCIDRLLNRGTIIHPKIRDLTRDELFLIHPSQRPKLLELNYTDEVRNFLKNK
ncbi:MAG: hypothetical protein JSU91_05800 [Thermoplasmatales archaeon]|nr:MAG: hypothetical protein JSU91_05800 [Thermoplasmatales archaeon]